MFLIIEVWRYVKHTHIRLHYLSSSSHSLSQNCRSLIVVLIWWCNNVCRNASGTTLHFYVTDIVSQLILSVQFYIPMVIMLNVWSLYCFIVVWYQLMLFMHPRLTSSVFWQSYVCPSASGGTAYWQRPMIHQIWNWLYHQIYQSRLVYILRDAIPIFKTQAADSSTLQSVWL